MDMAEPYTLPYILENFGCRKVTFADDASGGSDVAGSSDASSIRMTMQVAATAFMAMWISFQRVE